MPDTAPTLLLIFMCSVLWVASSAAEGTPWPKDGRTAISLNYDDALDSQLDNALPALNQFGFKASFYLTLASPTVSARLAEWRALANQGHELGNHTLFHHCRASLPDRHWVQPHQDLDTRSPAQLQEEVSTANSFLTAIDGQSTRTFTPPCGDILAGGKNYLNKIAPYFLAIKGQEPASLNAVWLSPTNLTGAELIERIQASAKSSRLINVTFHGIGADYLAISTIAHKQLLAYLATNSDIYYVASYREIAGHFSTR